MTDPIDPIDPIVTFDIFPCDYSVTGIRSEDAENTVVIITGSCPPSASQSANDTLGMIYRGPKNPNNTSGCSWDPVDSLGCICRLPKIEGAASAIFYGPNTTWFTPSLEGKIRVVGSYRLQTGYNHGVMYTGPLTLAALDEKDNWKTIDMDPGVAGGAVANTILHSNMGDLIVGNYDMLVASVADGKFNAMIYNVLTKKYFDLKAVLGLDKSRLVTAYGIWKNKESKYPSTAYTIAGGIKDENAGRNIGFLVDFDPDSGTTSHPTEFPYDDAPSHITHFEGITKYGKEPTDYGPRYYSLAATGDKDDDNRGAAFAVVERNPDNGSFVPAADWQRVEGASSPLITGNTVLENNLFGIYAATCNDKPGIQSYVTEDIPVDLG